MQFQFPATLPFARAPSGRPPVRHATSPRLGSSRLKVRKTANDEMKGDN